MHGLLQPFYFEPARHFYRLFKNGNYRRYSALHSKLGKLSRYVECSARVFDWNLQIPDAASFLASFKEIFVDGIYTFPKPQHVPRILDLGANVGLSVLFFKRLFPDALIDAYEPDPKIFEYLHANVTHNGLKGVTLHQKAAWTTAGSLEFWSEGADGGRVCAENVTSKIGFHKVEAVALPELLRSQPYDLVKMDIEGAEEIVLPACASALDGVKFLFFEYHSQIGRPQQLGQILSLMEEKGFRVHIHSLPCASSPTPFVARKNSSGFDLQLNIFCWRDIPCAS